MARYPGVTAEVDGTLLLGSICLHLANDPTGLQTHDFCTTVTYTGLVLPLGFS